MRKLPSDAVSSSAGKVGGVVDRSGKLIFSDKHHRQRSSGNTHGDTMYVTMRGGTEVHIHPSSVMFDMSVHPTKRERLPKYVVFAEQVLTSKCYIRYASRIEGEWLTELHPELYRNPHGSSRGNTNVASNVPSVASHSANKASQRGLVGASSLGVSKASQPPYIEPSLLGKRKEK
jgi:HrpA-like RNA helicase